MSQTRSSGPDRPRTSRTAPRRAGAGGSRSSAPVLDRPADPPSELPPLTPGDPSARQAASRPAGRRRRAITSGTRPPRKPRASASPRVPRGGALTIVRAPRHRLVVVCTAALATGMLCVLLLNTVISQGAFDQYRLEVALIHASEAEERLSRQVQLAEAPLEVERRARALGMVPAAAPVFLRLSDGAVLGEPVPAPPAPGKVSFAGAPGWQSPRPSPTGSPAATAPAAAPGTENPPSADPVPTGAPSAAGASGDPGSPDPGPEPTAQPSPAHSPTAGLRPTPRGVTP